MRFTMRQTLVLFLLFCLPVFSGCSDDDDPESSTPPVLTQTPVNISGPFDAQDETFGDVSFASSSPVLRPFGILIAASTYSRRLDYYTTVEAPVVAASNGIVSAVFENPFEEGDFEVHVTSIPGSDFTIIYDHVNRVLIQEDLAVVAGDTIGTAGNFSETVGRFSLQISTGAGVDQRWHCPLTYGDDAFIEAHELLLDEYQSRGLTPRYDSLCVRKVLGPSD